MSSGMVAPLCHPRHQWWRPLRQYVIGMPFHHSVHHDDAGGRGQAEAPEAHLENVDNKVPSTPTTIHRKDYRPTPYQVDQVDLTFQLLEDATIVQSRLQMRPTHNGGGGPAPIVFNGLPHDPLFGIVSWLSLDLCLAIRNISKTSLTGPSLPRPQGPGCINGG